MEDKLIPSGPAFAMAVIFLVMGIDHLARFSHQRAFPNLVIGLPTLAIVPTYLKLLYRDWVAGLRTAPPAAHEPMG
jgi:hypothetical protein